MTGLRALQLRFSLFAMVALSIFLAEARLSPAHAQSAVCNNLRAELAASGRRSGGNSRKYKQYTRAIQSQEAQLNKTNRALRSCGFALSNKCRRIKGSIKKMRANLRSLKNTRAKFAGKSGRSRASIEKSLRRNRCNGIIPVSRDRDTSKPKRRSLLEQVFGVKTFSNDGKKSTKDYEGSRTIRGNYNTVRSICVRTCDGYYFPVSFSTTKDRLQGDAEQCASMCPGTETALFYHKMPSQDSEESISYRTGKPYSSLENAFAYRKSVNPECSCRFATTDRDSFKTIAGKTQNELEEAKVADKEEIQRIGLPVYRQDPFNDPDSLDNELGRLNIAAIKDLTGTTINADGIVERSNSNIRIVGPAFFPVQ